VLYFWRGERLKAKRKMQGYTAKKLAQKIGTHHNHIALWERDESEPFGAHLVALCEILKTEPRALYECHIDMMKY